MNPTWVQLRNPDWESSCPGCNSGLNEKVRVRFLTWRGDQNEILA